MTIESFNRRNLFKMTAGMAVGMQLSKLQLNDNSPLLGQLIHVLKTGNFSAVARAAEAHLCFTRIGRH